MTLAAASPIVSCTDVTVVYGRGHAKVRALDGVTFTCGERARVALLGRSGSGKTTLLHVLGGLVEPSDGSLDWKGRPASPLDRSARAKVRGHRIAYVFQGANLLPYFSALENVRYAATLTANPDPSQPGADVLLELVGLSGKRDHLPAELSGGEAQRVAIARALAQQPKLLLCDEPTGHLDSDTASRVLDLIDALQFEFGFAIVLATHADDVAARFDRIVELDDGQIVGEEPS